MKYYYTYKVTLPSTGEFYIGRKTSKVLPQEDSYMGSMSAWKIDKNLLVKEILETYNSSDDLESGEIKLIGESLGDPLNKNGYVPGKGFIGGKLSEEALDKMRKSLAGREGPKKGIPRSQETKDKISKTLKGKQGPWAGKTRSKEDRDAMSKAHKGKILSEEHKNNMRGKIPWNKGFKKSK